jgi:internalin A
MTEKRKALRRISSDELEEVLAQIALDGLCELILLGPRVNVSPYAEKWPAHWQECPHIYQLTEFVGDLCEKLVCLTHFTSLELRGNEIGDAGAKHLSSLVNLTTLNLMFNQVGDAGAKHLSSLVNLTSLDLGRNEIGEAGAKHLSSLVNLTSLNLMFNQVGEAGAKHLSSLVNLTTLNLMFNQVGDAGAKHLSSLVNLTSLDLGSNEIGEAGAKHLSSLVNLTSLKLRNNKIVEAGAKHLSSLVNLTSLDLGSNEIGDAGAKHLSSLVNLTSLDLGGNEIGEAGAKHLSSLVNLTTLNLMFNQVGEAGAKHLSSLVNLTTLNLMFNQVGDAGAKHLSSLVNLTSLDLGSNEIGEAGAKHLSSLVNLTSLDLGSNEIGEAGAKHLSSLVNLTSLDLGSNEIGEAGAKHLSSLVNLTSLNLEGNQISDLTTFSNLLLLRMLDVSNTQVVDLSPLKILFKKDIPPKWDDGQFENEGVFVKDCPLKHPPPEIVKQGNDAVLNYFEEIRAQDIDQLLEAKVLIVGEGRAGKTSLLCRLYRPGKPLPTEDETTKGIDIHRHDFSRDDGRIFRLNVWDFGGQQIYHATHQFFLTKNSLYILLDDTAKDHKSVTDEGFRYWLEVIELLSDHSPVLIFQNEKGGRSKKIDQAGIKGRFPNVKDIYQGNLEKTDSAADLSNAIKLFAQQLPHVGEDVPKQWVKIREDIEQEAEHKPYISQQDYFDLYRRHLEFNRI